MKTNLWQKMAVGFVAMVACSATFAADALNVITNYTGEVTKEMLRLQSGEAAELLLVYTDTFEAIPFTLKGQARARILAVGGGGSGGARGTGVSNASVGLGGGGGGGGVVEKGKNEPIMLYGGEYSVLVGKGGTGNSSGNGQNGGDTKISYDKAEWVNMPDIEAFYSNEIIAVGGGGGGSQSAGSTGASGGGGSAKSSSSKQPGGACSIEAVQHYGNIGYPGGYGNHTRAGAGGGGAGGPGGDTVKAGTAGNGGEGYECDITGVAKAYGGGGGGGVYSGVTFGKGKGGGGNGGGASNAGSGEDGTGGGGGGAGKNDSTSGKGGNGIVIIRISAIYDIPSKPESLELEYTGSEQWILPSDGPYTYEGIMHGVEVCTHEITVTLFEGLVWSDGTSDPFSAEWSIVQARNEILTINISNWDQYATPGTPSGTSKFGDVYYEWRKTTSDGEWSSWTDSPPTDPGIYYLCARVAEAENWSAAERTMEFTIWPLDVCPASGLGRFIKLDFSKLNTNETLENFVVYMALSNNTPAGFDYAEVDEEGSDIRFCDANGTVYPHEIDEWNYGGTSHIWFRLPQVNKDTVVYMCWGATTEGQMPSVGDPSQIWSDYVAVWHMDETKGTAFVASSTPMRDATGNGYDAEPMNDSGTDLPKNEMTGVEAGKIGHGRQNSNNNWQNGNYFKVPDYTKEGLGSVFEMSAWVRYSKSNTPNDYIQVWSRKPSTGNADLSGWHAEITSNSSRRNWQIRGSGNAAWSGDILSSDSKFNTWVYVSLVYSNETLRVYRDGALYGTKNDINPVIDNGLPLMIGRHYVTTPNTYGGMFDEMRLCRVARSAAWIKANYDQISGTKIWNQSDVMTGKDARLFNKWKESPALSKVWWNIGDAPATVYRGVPLYGSGTVKLTVKNQETGATVEVAVGDEQQTYLASLAIGHYIAIFDVEETGSYRGLSESLTFHVVEAKPGEITYDIAEGRIMTAGNEAAVDGKRIAVTTMGHYDEAHWIHEEPRGENMLSGEETTLGNLLFGSYHYYYGINKDSGEPPVWILKNVRIGNTMTNEIDVALSENSKYNYLPWSEPIQPNSSATAAGSRNEVAHLVMLNKNTVNVSIQDKDFGSEDIEGPVIESGWFTNGVGTVFFDAVNGRADNVAGTGVDNYKLRLQYGYLYEDNGLNRLRWVTVPVVRHQITNSVMDAGTTFEDEIPLTMDKGGTKDNFYRIAANINTNASIKIRIVRTGFAPDNNSSTSEEGEEVGSSNDIEDSPILIDNILVSYPSAAVCFSSYGKYDQNRNGNQILGLEGAWNVPFPSITEKDNLIARAKADYSALKGVANTDTSGYIQQAIMHYRWRYLTQQVGSWNSVFLEKDDSEGKTFTARNPLKDIPDRVGDIEFWYELACDMPYFTYVDYSGTDLGIPNFGDRTVVVTNRASFSAINLPTGGGTDWFVRLRNGKSLYEGARVEITEHSREGDNLVKIDMELAGDGVWKGYYATTTNNLATNISWRIVMENRQRENSTEFAENSAIWYIEDVKDDMPISDTMQVGDANSWTTIKFNPSTGFVMFQIEENTRGVSVVHADYQNFNQWTDAAGAVFKGSSALDEKKIGTSNRKQEFALDFKGWTTMEEVKAGYWDPFSFSDTKFNNMRGQPVGVFTDGNITLDDSGWVINGGKWISRVHSNNKYGTGVALQMKGQGAGSMSFSNSSVAPRGVKTVDFNARIAQEIEFQDFAYYTGQAESSISNYTFLTYGAFDLKKNTSFDGVASLSLVGYYSQSGSCYEGRFEWIGKDIYNASTDASTDVMDGAQAPANNKGQRFCLYRWNLGDNKVVPKPTLLAAYTNTTFDISGSSGPGEPTFPMFLCITNIANSGTCILFGVGQAGLTPSANNSAGLRDTKWSFIRYYDTSSDRLKTGTYGVLSRNSDGYFLYPQTGGIVKLQSYTYSDFQINWLGSYNNNLWKMTSCKESLEKGLWRYPLGKTMKHDISLGGIPYIKQNIFTNNYVDVSIGTPDNSGKFTRKARIVVDSFKSKRYSVPIYSYEKASIKISSGNESDDIRVDPVIDTVRVSQNCGQDWKDFSESLIPGWVSPSYSTESPVHTNFEFRSAWIVPDELYAGIRGKSALLLSAKRTAPDKASCIRSPLSDGEFKRSIGLGMISYEYYNAQPNARLLIQIATNVNYGTVGSLTDSATDSRWITIATNDFSNLTSVERRHGIFSQYIGLHGVKGVARIVVDPKLVATVANQTDPERFGEVYISKVTFKDEPSLDSSCWWGWNVRNVAPIGGQDKEGRMILHDMSSDPTASGMSMAMNWSAFDNVSAVDRVDTVNDFPFVQTPLFTGDVIGEISFKARKYDNSASSQPAAVVLLGTPDGATWEWVNVFNITNTYYETYSFKTSIGKAYKGFRMIVSGAKGVEQIPLKDADGIEHIPCVQPLNEEGTPLYDNAVRVMIDEVVVSEAIRARMAFKNVGVFRNHMSETEVVPDVPSYKEQPIVGEGWGVQCEVYPAQLADEVDLDKEVRVLFYWYPDFINWGFNNWRYKAGAKCAELARATDSGDRMIFRSSDITCPEAVVDEADRFNICQYSLEVIYYQKTSSKPVTNELTAADWKRPDWYEPVDYNTDFGKGGVNFSAYNIIDTVAPKWAWINEANIAGSYNNSDSDRQYQFIEIACPMEADLNGWSLRSVDVSAGDGKVITNNQFCVFDQTTGKKDTRYAQSNMSFRVVGSPLAQSNGALSRGNGTLDAVWNNTGGLSNSQRYERDGRVSFFLPVAFQLVRPSGVIEHQVVLIGTNFYDFSAQYDPEKFKDLLNDNVGKEIFIFAGSDDSGNAATITGTSYEGAGTSIYGTGASLGVMSSHGETEMNWSNDKKCTPGSVNDGQIILSEELPAPQGKNIRIYCSVDNLNGHIVQTVGDGVETDSAQIVVVKKGSETGTNITYKVAPWYEMGSVTTNGLALASSDITKLPDREYVVTVGVGVSNNVSVVASAAIDSSLRSKYGLDENNKYTAAIMDWLEKGKDLYGNDWYDKDGGKIYLAQYRNIGSHVLVTNLSLNAMYWLDMDPTIPLASAVGAGEDPVPSALSLVGGISEAALPHPVKLEQGDGTYSVLTNMRLQVSMYITNANDSASWTPYALRGSTPGTSTFDLTNKTASAWSGVSFKIIGYLHAANPSGGTSVRDNWVPLRYFYFNENSFRPVDDATAPHTSDIELIDPFSTSSLAVDYNWHKWFKENGADHSAAWYFWSLDDRIKPVAIEKMKEENYYPYESVNP